MTLTEQDKRFSDCLEHYLKLLISRSPVQSGYNENCFESQGSAGHEYVTQRILIAKMLSVSNSTEWFFSNIFVNYNDSPFFFLQ